MSPKQYINLQFFILSMIILFGISLLFGVTIPKGPEGEWFRSIWEIILAVGNIAGLAVCIKQADTAADSAGITPGEKGKS